MSAVRLLAVHGAVLHVTDVDILNATPLLDIKPYVSEYDSYANQRGGWLDDRGARRDVHISDERFLDSADEAIFRGPDP